LFDGDLAWHTFLRHSSHAARPGELGTGRLLEQGLQALAVGLVPLALYVLGLTQGDLLHGGFVVLFLAMLMRPGRVALVRYTLLYAAAALVRPPPHLRRGPWFTNPVSGRKLHRGNGVSKIVERWIRSIQTASAVPT
jgi:hypothetical protein